MNKIHKEDYLLSRLRKFSPYKPDEGTIKKIFEDRKIKEFIEAIILKFDKIKQQINPKAYGNYAEMEAQIFYKKLSFTIENRSNINSSGCDFLASRGSEKRMVEVKCKVNIKNKKIPISIKQIKNAQELIKRDKYHYDLFVLRGVDIDDKTNKLIGGIIHLESDFSPNIKLTGEDFRKVDYTLREKNNKLKEFK